MAARRMKGAKLNIRACSQSFSTEEIAGRHAKITWMTASFASFGKVNFIMLESAAEVMVIGKEKTVAVLTRELTECISAYAVRKNPVRRVDLGLVLQV